MQQGLLEIETFQEITGIILETDADIAMFNRANARASRFLIKYLGWDPGFQEIYTEAAISSAPGVCPTEEQFMLWKTQPNKYNGFLPGEASKGQYKLLPYYPEDANYFIDPAFAVYAVKIVKILSGNEEQFITVRQLNPEDFNKKTNNNFIVDNLPIIKWLEICNAPMDLPCVCGDSQPCYMLAIDADWVNILPDDLLYLLADLVVFYMQHQPSINKENTYAIKSESVDGHSVTYDTTTVDANTKNSEMEVLEPYMAMLQYYIGPYSTLYTNKTRIL